MQAIASVLLTHGDLAGAAQVEEAMAHHRWDEGERTDAMELMSVALDHARSSHDRQTATRIVAWLCDAIAEAPDPGPARADIEALGWVGSFSPLVEVKRLTSLALVEARAGSVATARSLIEVARALAEDLGQPPAVSGLPDATKEIERIATAEQAGLAKDV
jgi:hypothetical protein